MAPALDEEELQKKGGVDLFKELLRLLPTADIQDYFKGGIWQDTIMRLDLRILEGHRQEAGSPAPIPLEEVRMPEMPKANAAHANLPLAALKALTQNSAGKVAPKLLSLAGKAAPKLGLKMPLTPAQVAAKAALLKRTLLRPGKVGDFKFPKAATAEGGSEASQASDTKTALVKLPPKVLGKMIPVPKAVLGGKLGPLAKAAKFGAGKPTPAKAGVPRVIPTPSTQDSTASGSSPSSVPTPTSSPSSGASAVARVVDNDLRQITAFVAKWKLDQTKAKLALAKLTPQKRSYVMANFKNQNAANGMSPIQKLESYINQCERLSSWNSPTAGVQSTPANSSTGGGNSPTASASPVKKPSGARTIPAPTRPPHGAKELASRAPAVAGRKGGFAGMGAKIAALRKTSSMPARAVATRTMAPKAPGKMVAPRPSVMKVGKWSPSSSSASGSSWGGKGSRPIGGTTAIGQGHAKRPYSSVASGSWQNDQKRQRTESSVGHSSSGSWGSGPSQSTPHAVAKGWAVPHAAAKAAVVAPKAPTRPVVVGAPRPNTWSGKPSAAVSTSTANRPSSSSWSPSGKGSSWSSGGKSTGKASGKNNASGKNHTSGNTSWGTGGSNNSSGSSNSWSQGGKANSKQGGRGVIRSLLKKF